MFPESPPSENGTEQIERTAKEADDLYVWFV